MKKMTKRLLSVIIAVVLVLGSTPLSGFVGLKLPDLFDFSVKTKAANSGVCGETLVWTFNETSGVLTLVGFGAMEDHRISIWDDMSEKVKSIVLPDGITHIGENCFKNFKNLREITFPDSVTSIGSGAFCNCKSLEKVVIPEGVKTIEYDTFSYCTNLNDITIHDGVKSIGMRAFLKTGYYNDESNWEDGILYIGRHIIDAKETITGSYETKSNVLTIAEYAFSSCKNIESITVTDNVKFIGDGAFAYCSSLKSVKLSNRITFLPNYAFEQCSLLENVEFGNKITKIGEYAFELCTSLAFVDFPLSLEVIDRYAFTSTALRSLTLTQKIRRIYGGAFSYCKALAKVNLNDNLEMIGEDAFYKSAVYNISSNWEDGMLYIGKHLIDANSDLPNDVVVKEGTLLLADYSFAARTNIRSVDLPESLKYLGAGCFSWCDKITEIVIPDGVTVIYDATFYEASNLAKITFSNNITRIRRKAFQGANITTINYYGTPDDWVKMEINELNEDLTCGKINYLKKATLSYKDINGEAVITGLEPGIQSLDWYMDFLGRELSYEPTSNGFGTGTKVNVLKNGTVVETYTLLFYGDVTGDGVIDVFDVSMVNSISNFESEPQKGSVYELAGDLNGDGYIDIYDSALMNAAMNFEYEIPQIL